MGKIYTKQQLMAVLERLNNDSEHVIFGEEQYTGKRISETIEGFRMASGGHTPGIIGIDMRILPDDKEEFAVWVDQIEEFCLGGGIFTLSHHFANPSGNLAVLKSDGVTVNQTPWGGCLGTVHTVEGYREAFKKLLTDGTELNAEFKKQLDRDAEFIEALKERGVPMMWRPFLEMNSRSFWWCIQQCDSTTLEIEAECFKSMWKYVYNYFTNEKGFDNLLWVFASANWNEELLELCYPGDEYVDIVGVDWYTEKDNDLVTRGVFKCLHEIAPDKLGALPEFGPGGKNIAFHPNEAGTKYTGENALADLVRLKKQYGYKFAYVMSWSCPWNIERMGGGHTLMDSNFTLGQNELANIFAQLDK